MTRRSKFLVFGGFVLFFGGIFLGGGVTYKRMKSLLTGDADTVYVQKIVEIPIPPPSDVLPAKTTTEIKKSDFISETDSTVNVQNDSVVYHGVDPLSKISYTATVAGLNPSLSSLQIKTEDRQIIRTVSKPVSGWVVSSFCDIGSDFQTVSIMSGFSAGYTLDRFNVHFDVGVYSPDLSYIRNVRPYIGAGIRIDIFRKK